MKAGVCTIAMKDVPVAEAIEACARAGAQGIELWGRAPHLPAPSDRAGFARVRRHLLDAGLELVALGSYLRPGPDPPASDEEEPHRVLAAAAELGCRLVRIWAGRKEYEESTPAEREAVYEGVRRMADDAQAAGCRLVLERHNSTLTNSWASAAAVIAALSCDHVRLCYQVPYPVPAHELRNCTDADFELLSLSAHAHLQNYREQPDGSLERTLLAEGIVDYGSFGRQVRRAGYDGYAMVEFVATDRGELSAQEALAADLAYIRSL